jgi:ribosomal protein S18 acetylase RimI-like enzyme
MGDMLVKLYALPDAAPALARVRAAGYDIRRPLPPERRAVVRWVDSHFGERWAGEAETAFSRVPVSCHLAVDAAGHICGFACHDVTFRGFFGPAGVPEKLRGQGLGTALLLTALRSLAASGYAYAVIGGSGDDEFYAKAVGAVPIPDSEPGPYGRWTFCSGDL